MVSRMTATHLLAQRAKPTLADPVVFILNGDDSARSWIEATVVSAGARAICCNTAAELLALVKPHTIACAILDVMGPKGSSFELQDSVAGAGIGTIFVTRERCISSCVRALRAGAIDFLTMPCDSIQLVGALKNAVSEARSPWTRRMQFN